MPVHEIADDDASSRKDRRARGEFQYDERGDLLRARVPMMLRDADRREVQRQIKADAARRELQRRIVDAAGNDGLALLKPGSRRLADASAYADAEAAYEQATRDCENAWRRGPGSQDALAHGTEYSGHEGDPCTVRAGSAEGYLEGSPGHLARVDGKLVCVPNEPAPRRSDSMSASDAQATKDRAYDEMCRRSEDAWRHLGESV